MLMTEQTIAQPTEKEWDTFLQKVLKEPSLLDSLAKAQKIPTIQVISEEDFLKMIE